MSQFTQWKLIALFKGGIIMNAQRGKLSKGPRKLWSRLTLLVAALVVVSGTVAVATVSERESNHGNKQ